MSAKVKSPPDVRVEFQRVRQIQYRIVLAIAVGTLVFVLGIAEAIAIPQASIVGSWLFGLGWTTILLAWMVGLVFVRCPACGKLLGRYEYEPESCRRCGAQFRD